MSEAWLTADEVETLTERKRWRAQCRMLARMGVPFRPNAVGRPLVERAAVLSSPPVSRERRTRPDWSALDRGEAAKT